MKLYVNDKVVAEGPMRTQPASSRCRATASASATTAATLSARSTSRPARSMAGRSGVGVTVEKAAYEDLEMEAQRALARD